MAERDRFRDDEPFRNDDWNRDYGRRREEPRHGGGRSDFDQGWRGEGDRGNRGSFVRDAGGRDRSYGDEERGFGGRDRGFGGGRERDFGDSAGYGSGGSALDYRDVVGNDEPRGHGRGAMDRAFGRGFGRGPGGRQDRDEPFERDRSSSQGRDRDERGFLERAGDEVASWFGSDDGSHGRREDARFGAGAQHHRGRGPRNYRRSDERIREEVNDRLTDDPHLDATHIEVAVQNREVTLTGTVRNRSEKRHAEDIADGVSGVEHVQNNLRVQQGSPGPGESAPPGSQRTTGGVLP